MQRPDQLNTTAKQNVAVRVVVPLNGSHNHEVMFYLRSGTATLLADLQGWHVDGLRGQVGLDGSSVGVRHPSQSGAFLDLGTLQAGKTYDVHIRTRTGSGAVGGVVVSSTVAGAGTFGLLPGGSSLAPAATAPFRLRVTGATAAALDYVVTVSSRLVVPVTTDTAPVPVRATRPGQQIDLVLGTVAAGRRLHLVTSSDTAGTRGSVLRRGGFDVASVPAHQSGVSRHRYTTTAAGTYGWHVFPPLGAVTAYQVLTRSVVPTGFTGEQTEVDVVENRVLWIPVSEANTGRLNVHVAPRGAGPVVPRIVSGSGTPIVESWAAVDAVTDGGRGMALGLMVWGTQLEVSLPAGRSTVTTSRPVVVPVTIGDAAVTAPVPLPGQEVVVAAGGRGDGQAVTVNVAFPDGWTGTTRGHQLDQYGNTIGQAVVRENADPTFLIGDEYLPDGVASHVRLTPSTPWPAGVELLASTAVEFEPVVPGGSVVSGPLRPGQAVLVPLSLPAAGDHPFAIEQPPGTASTVVQRSYGAVEVDEVSGTSRQGVARFGGVNPTTLVIDRTPRRPARTRWRWRHPMRAGSRQVPGHRQPPRT